MAMPDRYLAIPASAFTFAATGAETAISLSARSIGLGPGPRA